MKSFLLLLFIPIVAFGQPKNGPYPVPGGGTTQTNINIGGVTTNGGANGQVATVGSDGTTRWSNSVASASSSGTTNDFLVIINSPLTNYVFFTFWGNSRMIGDGPNAWTNWGALFIQNYTNRMNGKFAGWTNVATSGRTVGVNRDEYTSLIHPLRHGTGTNDILVFCDTVNDPIQGTNILSTLLAYSNILNSAVTTDGFIFAGVSSWEPNGASKFTGEQASDGEMANIFVRSNALIRYFVDVATGWSTVGSSGDTKADGLHPSEVGTFRYAEKLWAELNKPASRFYASPELHIGDFAQITAPTFNSLAYSYHGLITPFRVVGKFANVVFDGGNVGGAGIGINLDGNANGRFSILTSTGVGGVAESVAITGSSILALKPLNITGSMTASLGLVSTISNAVTSAAITFPATTVKWTNTFGLNIVLYVDNTAVTGTAIVKNGQQIFSGLSADVPLMLKPGDYFSETYTVGTPSARWEPQ